VVASTWVTSLGSPGTGYGRGHEPCRYERRRATPGHAVLPQSPLMSCGLPRCVARLRIVGTLHAASLIRP
jgi:hypothetical protein